MKKILITLITCLICTGAFAKDDARFNECRDKLKKANKLEVLYDLDWKLPNEPRVVVGRTFYSMSFDAKQNFAGTVNCFLMAGESGKYINFDILDWKSGNAVGRYSYGKLKMK